MVVGHSRDMLPKLDTGPRGFNGNLEDSLQSDLEVMLRPQCQQISEPESNLNINPRLPPPLLSKEDWPVAQRFQVAVPTSGGIEGWGKRTVVDDCVSLSLFAMQPGVYDQKAEEIGRYPLEPTSTDWLERGSDRLIGLSDVGHGMIKKSIAGVFRHNGLDQLTSLSGSLLHPESHNAFGHIADTTNVSHGPRLPPVGSRVVPIEKKNILGINAQNGHSAGVSNLDIAASLCGLSLSNTRQEHGDTHKPSQLQLDFDDQPNFSFRMPNTSNISFNGQQSLGFRRSLEESNVGYQNAYNPIMDITSHVNGCYSCNRSLNSAIDGDYFCNCNGILEEHQRAYFEALLAQQRRQYEMLLFGKYGGMNHGYYNQSYGHGTAYPESPMFQHMRASPFSSMMRNSMGGSIGTNVEGRVSSSLLDEFKNNNRRMFELSDIFDHVVEFSTDQFGSRFIQDKLEIATVKEKTMILTEIVPHAHSLMTDVFGNYVIQKLFEHGTERQRKELASQLSGWVLHLSLHMYGCRVIQKALEVVSVDLQTLLVAELDGSVMKCIRDHNGNHVIQKCIECVLHDQIQFIISAFYGQVVKLSTHPYGCRMIQRLLEHCHDLNTQQIIMDEIMQSVCHLAQDQYGNYVIQHVVEHGKTHERTVVISKLSGHMVKMSQHKFASNVVEKCLTFGAPEERQKLVNEILGSNSKDENDPLQDIMKDQYGNYVVQKVLETCNDESLELILSRIKTHLDALKKYSYGKHIVSRIEKLIKTGERRIGSSS